MGPGSLPEKEAFKPKSAAHTGISQVKKSEGWSAGKGGIGRRMWETLQQESCDKALGAKIKAGKLGWAVPGTEEIAQGGVPGSESCLVEASEGFVKRWPWTVGRAGHVQEHLQVLG